MSLPYFPMYPSDFEAKTSHLTLLEDGVYNRLLRLCWMTPGCSIPADEAWIMRRLRARTDEEQEAARTILGEFFTVDKQRYSNARLTREFHAANEAHEKRKSAGARGGAAKHHKTNKTASSNARAMPKQPEPEPEPYIEDTDVSSQGAHKRASRLPEDWHLPRDWGDWALGEGWSDNTIRQEADKFRDYWISASGQKATKRDWFATWRNWLRNVPKQEKLHGKSKRDGEAAARAARIGAEFGAPDVDSGGSGNAPIPLLSARRSGGGY